MPGKQKILIVDDDENIAELISLYLKKECFDTNIVYNGEDALAAFETYQPNLILLDLMLPGIDGYQVCREIRAKSATPIIMLSAKTEDIDKITGLNVGADDYVSKPFVPMELMARVKAQLRRYRLYDQKENIKNEGVFQVRGLILNTLSKEVMVDGQLIHVTPIEYRILELLIQSPGRVFSTEQIYEQVWQEEAVNTDTVMVHVRNLREKIEVNPKQPQYLKVVWGIGYKIER